MTNLQKIIGFTFLLCCISNLSYAQNITIEELKNKISGSDYKYFKVVSSNYEDGKIIVSDTLEYVTKPDYVYFNSKNTEYLTQEHSVLIDHENKMIALALRRKGDIAIDLDMLSKTDTTASKWNYNKENNYFYYSIEEGKDKVIFQIHLSKDNKIKKTVYTTYIDGIEKKQVLTYLVFCLDTTCLSNKKFPQLQNIVEEVKKKKWVLTQYKDYSLSVY